MSMHKGSYSKFFKVYLPDESGDDLDFPVSFNSSLPKPLPRNVTVRSIYGKTWKLALRKCGGDDVERYALVNGWKRIAKDETLNGGDLLTFEFDGSRCFNFCIYDARTMCKRLRRRSSEQTNEIKEESDAEEEDADDDDNADYNDDDDDEAEDDDDDRKYLDDKENPYFTAFLNPKKASQLPIPAMVIKDYGLNFPERISIVDPLSNNYGPLERKVRIQVNRVVFVMGFGSVLRRNVVKTTDKMVCEVMKTGNNNLVHTIKVHIIRG
ncbi:unnamed protein product [Microthlaspi erraticum]|uniref:TF-B3 domain-containing protein n=1 Tax=Microthlaspi erraticum TaxID=1685480 RepID=A0A6D2ISL9_9BRAS|nr:unnamed protein product [Microthlaspi erraticum]